MYWYVACTVYYMGSKKSPHIGMKCKAHLHHHCSITSSSYQ